MQQSTQTTAIQGGAKKRGQPISMQIFWKFHDRIAWKLVNFCNIICWTQSLTFCLKKFIALWRHLAKTQLPCDAQIYLYNVNKRLNICNEMVAPFFSAPPCTSRWTCVSWLSIDSSSPFVPDHMYPSSRDRSIMSLSDRRTEGDSGRGGNGAEFLRPDALSVSIATNAENIPWTSSFLQTLIDSWRTGRDVARFLLRRLSDVISHS